MPLLSIISHAFPDHEHYLWLSPGQGDLFFGWNAFHVLEVGDEEGTRFVLSKYHELVFDLGTSTGHLTDWIYQGELKYSAYIGFTKPNSIPREVAVPRPVALPLWRQFISLVSPLGIATDGIRQFGIQTSALSDSYAETLLDFDTGLPLVCLAPGASCDGLKQWPPECFAAFMKQLQAKKTCRFVLVGSRSERQIGDAIAAAAPFEIDNIIGLTTLGSVAYVLRKSGLLVSNDNGAMHLGGLVGVPTIALFGPSNPEVYTPLGNRTALIVSHSGKMADIHPEHVVNASLDAIG
ncbi:MAG: glycosyltransferase family 9 protein [Thermodesulfobacteriota bacterium]